LSKREMDATDLTEPAQVLFILIPAAWLAIATMVVAACTMAARGDQDMVATGVGDIPPTSLDLPPQYLPGREIVVGAQPRATATRPRHRSLRARGDRARGARSAAGS
jgi:hypothetical protein